MDEQVRAALIELIDAVTRAYPLSFAVRLEAYYQHYARYIVMAGGGPKSRDRWWRDVVGEDPRLAAVLVCESGFTLPDAEGALL